MSLHKVFHAGLAASQISKWGAKEESGMAKYAKDTVFGYVYQELKKQTRVKTQWISGRWPVRWFWQCYTLTEGHDVMAANCGLVKANKLIQYIQVWCREFLLYEEKWPHFTFGRMQAASLCLVVLQTLRNFTHVRECLLCHFEVNYCLFSVMYGTLL